MSPPRLAALDQPGPDQPGPGERLRRAREVWGLSVEQVSATLHLPTRVITALEREDYQGLPPKAFVRGYLSGYARMLGLDAVALLAECETRGCCNSKLAARRSLHLSRGRVETVLRWGSYVALVGFVVAALSYWIDPGLEPGDELEIERLAVPDSAANPGPGIGSGLAGVGPASTSVAAPAQGDPQGQPIHPLDVGGTVAAAGNPMTGLNRFRRLAIPEGSASVPVGGALDTSPVRQGAGASPVAQPAAQATPQAADWATLELVFDADSWLAVVDAQGQRIAWETVKAGSSRSVSGAPPLKVVLGNASSVHVTYGGQPIDPAPHTRGRIARFSVE